MLTIMHYGDLCVARSVFIFYNNQTLKIKIKLEGGGWARLLHGINPNSVTGPKPISSGRARLDSPSYLQHTSNTYIQFHERTNHLAEKRQASLWSNLWEQKARQFAIYKLVVSSLRLYASNHLAVYFLYSLHRLHGQFR